MAKDTTPPPAPPAAPVTPADLQAQLAALQAELASTKAKLATGELDDELAKDVAWRRNAGLSYEDALGCARRQLAHDKYLAAKAAQKAEAIAEATTPEK